MATPRQEVREGRERWPRRINCEEATNNEATEYVMFKCVEFEYYDLQDNELWEMYKWDFEGFTLDLFEQCDIPVLRKLRYLLRERGVWIETRRAMTLPKSLFDCLQEKRRTLWTEEEIIEHITTTGPFHSKYVNHSIRRRGRSADSATSVHTMRPAQNTQNTTRRDPIRTPVQRQPDPPLPPNPADVPLPPESQDQFQDYSTGSYNRFNQGRDEINTRAGDRQKRYQERQDEDQKPQELYQDQDQRQESSHNRELATLIKIYSENDKYSGEGDSFDYKLQIFEDLCEKANIPDKDNIRVKAYSTMLRGLARDHYFANITVMKAMNPSFEQMCSVTRNYFEGEEHRRNMLNRWNTHTLGQVIQGNEGKSMQDCLQILIKDLRHIQHGLDPDFRKDSVFRNKLITACRGVEACRYACYMPSESIPGLINNLKSSIATWDENQPKETSQFFTDRRYHSRTNAQRPQYLPRTSQPRPRFSTQDKKKCFICKKEGCWSSNHTKEEQESEKRRFKAQFNQRFDKYARQYIAEFEGARETEEDDSDGINEAIEAMIAGDIVDQDNQDQDQDQDQDQSEHFITAFGTLQSQEAMDITTQLANQSFQHGITAKDTPRSDLIGAENTPATDPLDPFAYTLTATSRYTADVFYGVMIDTGASKKSTAGYNQYIAFRKSEAGKGTGTEINTSTAGAVNVQFGIGSTPSIGSIQVQLPVGRAEFHIVQADTPFLLCLADMDTLQVYYNNIKDQVITPSGTVPVVRRFGHPFILWSQALHAYITESLQSNTCYLTETELRRLHRRFGHPSANRLHRVLGHAGHEVEKKALHRLTRVCEHCQKHGKSPGRFKFTLRDDNIDFNHSIYIDIMYIEGQPVLHIIDEATRYQAARWMKDISAKHTWDLLRLCWIDTYVGPPEYVVHDAGKNFISREFRQNAKGMAISTKSVPVEAHWSIGLVERAHPVLRRAYQVIKSDLPDITRDIALQMAVKAVNDTAGPGGLVPTLLVYGAYPRMTNLDPPSPSIIQRAEAVHKAMNEVTKIRAQIQVKEALKHRNGPDTSATHDLPLNSDVLVWREGNTGQSGRWTGPFKLVGMRGETCIIQQPRGPIEFRSTVVKPYHYEEPSNQKDQEPSDQEDDSASDIEAARLINQSIARPDITIFLQEDDYLDHFTADQISQKPFASSRQRELSGLLESGVFEIVDIEDVPHGIRVFNSRFVDEIKNKGTNRAFEKSRLVVQAYKDMEKDTVLTQSPTIQRVSQRLILALAATIQGTGLYLRDITQAYTQSKTDLNRQFYVRPPIELELPKGTILRVIKPLYGVPEAGNHWFNTYHSHHIQELRMSQSTYDPCLLHTGGSTQYKGKGDRDGFGLVGLQTDDTLILGDARFTANEATAIKRAQFQSKEREQLTKDHPLKFNGGNITLQKDGSITLTQERQCRNLELVHADTVSLTSIRGTIRKLVNPKDQYVAQRARGAYIATVSQPEAAFDLSQAAQTTDPREEEVKRLNKRLEWQINNPGRGLRFVQLDKNTLKLVIFTDGSFANNPDYSSQIGYVICLMDSQDRANILHWSSIKCKRVTRSVLASELYAMAHGFDMGAVIKTTIEAMNILPNQTPLPLVICTDSKSLYDCLVKLGTTAEKRLMIDIMCLRQSYERREIAEVKWIEGECNPADAMTKSKPCAALKSLIDTNTINIRTNNWVERKDIAGKEEEPGRKLEKAQKAQKHHKNGDQHAFPESRLGLARH